jgi:hypothetical protein
MKKYFGKLVALALFAVALTGAALAQDNAHMVRANIPFNFYAGGQLLPAGEYTISINLENRVAMIGQKATGRGYLLLAQQGDSARDDRTVLTFKLVDGEVYALRGLRGPDLGGLSFNAKRPERAMKVQNQKGESVTIIAEAR